MATKPKPTKYIVTMTITTLDPVFKADVREFVELKLKDEFIDGAKWTTQVDKIRVNRIDFD